MKKYILLTAVFAALLLASCNTEDPLPASAEFTTNIQNNTLATNEGFTIYTSEAEGEFLTYFKGNNEESSWPDGFGRSFEVGTDSVVLSAYGLEGTYTFTLVATSYGDWGETVDQDVQSVEINVVAAN